MFSAIEKLYRAATFEVAAGATLHEVEINPTSETLHVAIPCIAGFNYVQCRIV